MKKRDYKPEIHALFEKERAKIKVEHEHNLSMLDYLEGKEERLLKRNTRDSLREIREYVRHRKKRTFIFPLAKKKYIILRSGKIKEVPFVKNSLA